MSAAANIMIDRSTSQGGNEARAAMPTVVVARSFDGGAPPLGLDQPLALLGGQALVPGILPGSLGLDWLPHVHDLVGRTSLALARNGTNWFRLSPTALAGATGCGRGHVASRIARRAGVPLLRINIASPSGAQRLRPESRFGSYAAPTPIVTCMAATRCANPIVLVDGTECAHESALEILAAMMDPEAGARLTEETLKAVIDLRGVSWLIQIPESGIVPIGLGNVIGEVIHCGRSRSGGSGPRFTIVDEPTSQLKAQSILVEVLDDLELRTVDYDVLATVLEAMAHQAGADAIDLYTLALTRLLATIHGS